MEKPKYPRLKFGDQSSKEAYIIRWRDLPMVMNHIAGQLCLRNIAIFQDYRVCASGDKCALFSMLTDHEGKPCGERAYLKEDK